MLGLVVDSQGRPTNISVLSPLGYGLDEEAIKAASKWRFLPGTKNGKPVDVEAQIEVTFRLQGIAFDDKTEKHRTAFNVALIAIRQNKITTATLDPVRKLVAEKYGPGLYLYAKLIQEGKADPADPKQYFELIQESAAQRYGPAMYEVAMAEIQGDQLPKDTAKGMELMHSAAGLGSSSAQWYLGQVYDIGQGVPMDFDKSRQYLRLCAAAGQAPCQYRLGKSLLEHSDHPTRDYVQAIAWLGLASDQKNEDAEALLQKEDERLTPAQVAGANKLKAQLVHKQ